MSREILAGAHSRKMKIRIVRAQALAHGAVPPTTTRSRAVPAGRTDRATNRRQVLFRRETTDIQGNGSVGLHCHDSAQLRAAFAGLEELRIDAAPDDRRL